MPQETGIWREQLSRNAARCRPLVSAGASDPHGNRFPLQLRSAFAACRGGTRPFGLDQITCRHVHHSSILGMSLVVLVAYHRIAGAGQAADQAKLTGSRKMRKILAVLFSSMFLAVTALAQTPATEQSGAAGATGAAAGGVTAGMVAAAVAVAAVAAAASASSNSATTTTTTTQ